MGDEKFKKHIGRGKDIEIKGDIFTIRPLTTEYLPEMFKAMKGMSGVAGKETVDMADFFKGLDEDAMKAITTLIDVTLARSFPNESKEDMKEFGMKHAFILFPVIMEINSSVGSSDDAKRKLDLIEQMKQNTKA